MAPVGVGVCVCVWRGGGGGVASICVIVTHKVAFRK